jgi:hypothetical protein
MQGYLLKNQQITIGENTYLESRSPENSFAVMFEDDTESGYFYAADINAATQEIRILDMLHIYDVESIAPEERQATASMIWSTDWLRCALVINQYCHAIFDFENQGGYSRHEFPPPNGIWTLQDRKLTDDMVTTFFR